MSYGIIIFRGKCQLTHLILLNFIKHIFLHFHFRVKKIVDPYLRQLTPDAEKGIIKACAKLAYNKIRQIKRKNKRKNEYSSSSSSYSSDSTATSSSPHCTSDEDMFEERRKKKKKKAPTSISQTQFSENDQETDNERDPLEISDN